MVLRLPNLKRYLLWRWSLVAGINLVYSGCPKYVKIIKILEVDAKIFTINVKFHILSKG